MNWPRIWTGTLLAGIAILLLDGVINHFFLLESWKALQQQGFLLHSRSYTLPVLILQDFGIGFVLTWLYALARPRLGPGPKTAVVTATLAWFLLAVPSSLFQWLWLPFPGQVTLIVLIGALVQCWTATYLAGWQYMERAP